MRSEDFIVANVLGLLLIVVEFKTERERNEILRLKKYYCRVYPPFFKKIKINFTS